MVLFIGPKTFSKAVGFLLVLVSLLYSTNVSAQKKLDLISAIDLKKDLDSLQSYLEQTHPDPYFRYPKKKFYRELSMIKEKIASPMNVLEFYLLIAPVLVKLGDGHTDLELPLTAFYTLNPDPFKLPVKVKFFTKSPYIVSQGNYDENSSTGIPADSEILSINGIPSKQIVNDIISMTAGESKEFRLAYGSSFFTFFLKELYNIGSTYDVKYLSKGKTHNIHLGGVRESELTALAKRQKQKKQAASGPYSLQVIDSLHTGIIDFRSFQDKISFNKFADSAFSLFSQKGINNLIIDVRYNLGGDSDIGDDFLQYLLESDFSQYSRIVKKYSRLQKERYLNNENTHVGDSAYVEMMSKRNGSIEVEYSPVVKKRDTPNGYTGRVFILTSPFTFSSAADFTQAVKHYQRGKVLGEETGGFIVSFGDIVSTELPASKLPLTISRNLYYNIGAKEKDFRGVDVDFKTDYRTALEFTLDVIRKERH